MEFMIEWAIIVVNWRFAFYLCRTECQPGAENPCRTSQEKEIAHNGD